MDFSGRAISDDAISGSAISDNAKSTKYRRLSPAGRVKEKRMSCVFRYRLLQSVLFVVLLSSLLGCTAIKGTKVSNEQKVVVVRVAAEYLENIVQANTGALDVLVYWDRYLPEQVPLTKKLYFNQVYALQKKATPENHPLVHLDLQEVSISGNDAVVEFQKFKDTKAPMIIIKLHWDGNAWLIEDDSLFGQRGLLSTLGYVGSRA